MNWMPLLADFSKAADPHDRRRSARRKLNFEAALTASRPPSKVVVLDLSEAGLMLHSKARLTVGEIFAVELPLAGIVEARVVWRRNTLYGCMFLSPVSQAALGALMRTARRDPAAVQA